MAKINGVEASLITGLGQIGVGPSPAPTTYPTGGLIANTGFFNNNSGSTVFAVNGTTPPPPPWYDRPLYGDGVSSASVWTKIASSTGTNAVYLLSSSGELFSAGGVYSYTGRPLAGFVAGRIDKVTSVTPTSSWTDIAVGNIGAIGINDGYLWATGQNQVGQWGSGSTALINLGGWTQVSTNQGWHRVECGSGYSLFMSGSGGSGSVWVAGTNSNGRTGQNTASGNTLNRAEFFGATGSIFTDMNCGAGNTTLLITSSAIWGCGGNGFYNLGDNTINQRTTIRSLYSGSTMVSVYSFAGFSKAISSESYHFHTGNTNNARGDGSSTALTVWTRVNTTGDLASGWQKFYGWDSNFYGTAIGVKDNRPYHLKSALNVYGAASPSPNRPWNDAVYELGSTGIGTWTPFISGSANTNITCSACAFTNYNTLTSPYLPAIWMYLTPH